MSTARATSTPRVVLVVGGTSGIGLAVAEEASRRGERVAVAARDSARVRSVADALPGEALGVTMDVVDPASVARGVAAVLERFGRVDAVVTSAQVMAYGEVEAVPPEVTRRLLETGVLGTQHLAQVLLPVFRAQGGGHLVVVSSLLAAVAVPAMGVYSAAKWGQLGLVRALQLETRRDPGVHVCLVLPGAIDTPIYHQAATYSGSRGSAPPPVISPERCARICLGLLDRPRRQVHAGPANRLTILGFRLLPWLYERIAGPAVDRVALRGPAAADGSGNVFAPRPAGEGLRGGWSPSGRLRGPDGRVRWRRR